MASPHPLLRHSKFAATLKYFDQYDYPLTASEQISWFNAGEVGLVEKTDDYFHLPGRSEVVKIRLQREEFSKAKWHLARTIGEKLKVFPFILAVFVTGSLAMNNTTKDDDIDFMIVTKASTLWTTRFFVNLFLTSLRRFPKQHNANNKICPNLWLDENNLEIKNHSLYQAHEILQAKVLWDRQEIQGRFFIANAWVKEYLPNAFTKQQTSHEFRKNNFWSVSILNTLFFVLQVLYMKPKMTTEKVGLGFAFFHPVKKTLDKNSKDL